MLAKKDQILKPFFCNSKSSMTLLDSGRSIHAAGDDRTRRAMAKFVLLALCIMPLLSFGCASSHDLTITSLDHHQCYRQGFSAAYANRNENGDLDVVLIDQAMEQSLSQSTITSPVRQVMHIRVVWAPTRDMHAVASNAAVNWYVMGQSEPQGMLQYSGIAFVSLDEQDDATTLSIRNATLAVTGNHGKLIDPVGTSKLEGTCIAHQDKAKVEKILHDINMAVAANKSEIPVASSGQ